MPVIFSSFSIHSSLPSGRTVVSDCRRLLGETGDRQRSVAPGQVTLLVGANGSGKSTVLRGIMGLLPICQGTVVLEGRRLTAPTHALRALGLAYMPQRRPVFGALSVRWNLALACDTIRKGMGAWRLAGRTIKSRMPDATPTKSSGCALARWLCLARSRSSPRPPSGAYSWNRY